VPEQEPDAAGDSSVDVEPDASVEAEAEPAGEADAESLEADGDGRDIGEEVADEPESDTAEEPADA